MRNYNLASEASISPRRLFDPVETILQAVDARGQARKIAMQTGNFPMQIGDFRLQPPRPLRRHLQTLTGAVNGASNVTQML